MATKELFGEILAEAERLRSLWDDLSADIPVWHPRNEGDGDGSGDGAGDGADGAGADGDGAGSADGAAAGGAVAAGAAGADGDGADGDAAGDGDGAGGDRKKDPEFLLAQSRKHERRAKQAAKERDELAARLKKIEESNQSEQEKAIAKAREEAEDAVTSRYETERRGERLELAATRHATKGVKLEVDEDGKKVEKLVKFADPDDAIVHLERAIARGDIDKDDIFDDDGKIQAAGLAAALAELLEDKPHLRASDGSGGGGRRPQGGADAGRGAGGGKSLEDMSVEDHAKRKYGKST